MTATVKPIKPVGTTSPTLINAEEVPKGRERPAETYTLLTPIHFQGEEIKELVYRPMDGSDWLMVKNSNLPVGKRLTILAVRVCQAVSPRLLRELDGKDYVNFALGKTFSDSFQEVFDEDSVTIHADGSWSRLLEYPTVINGILYTELTFLETPKGKWVEKLLDEQDKRQGDSIFKFLTGVSKEGLRTKELEKLHIDDVVAITGFLDDRIQPDT